MSETTFSIAGAADSFDIHGLNLNGLADQIADDSLALFDANQYAIDRKIELTNRDNELSEFVTGSNDAARKKSAQTLREADADYNRILAEVRNAERQKVILEARIERCRRYWSANFAQSGAPIEAYTQGAKLTHRVS